MKFRIIIFLTLLTCGVFVFGNFVLAVDYFAEYWDTENADAYRYLEITNPGATPDATETISNVDFNLGEGALIVNEIQISAGDGFRIRYTKDIDPGVYDFNLGSDDGSRVYVGDYLVMNMWAPQSYTVTTSNYINILTQELKIEYYENASDARLTFSYTRTDPQVSYYNPTDDATAVGVDAIFEINFDEDIVTSTGDIVLYKTSDDSIVETIDIASSKITAPSTTALLINPATTLDSETGYYFTIASSTIDDTSGNGYLGMTASTTWSFITADVNNPTVSYLNPVDNATAIGVGATFEINFNENIATSTGNIMLYKTSDDSIVETIDIASALITASSTTALIIDPSTTLDSETGYYLMIDATAIDDTSGNSFVGITVSTTWRFTTADVNNPIVSYLNPLDGATAVGVGETFEINFDEAIVTSTGNIILYKTSDDSTVETIDITSALITVSSTTALVIDPSTTLDSETEYYFMVGATTVDDISGNSFSGIIASTTWNFTTADIVAPTLSSLSPADDATDVAIDASLIITLGEDVVTSTGNIILYKTSDDSTVESIDISGAFVTASGATAFVINPTSDFDYETEYYVKVTSTTINDVFGNSYAGITTTLAWSFTTVDTPLCPTFSNASTYNVYPTCGVVTCGDGYTLTGGSCVLTPTGGGSFIPPSIPKVVIPPTFNNDSINSSVTNVYQMAVSYSEDFSGVSWEYYNESYKTSNKTLYIKFRSEDGGVSEVYTINPAVVKSEVNTYENKLIKYNNSSKVYLIENGLKRWIVSGEVFNYHNYDWNKIINIGIDNVYDDGDNITKSKLDTNYKFTRNLELGITGEDVKVLQQYLNSHGFEVSPAGQPGSVGRETIVFGYATQNALIRFQESVELPPYGYFGPMTRAIIN